MAKQPPLETLIATGLIALFLFFCAIVFAGVVWLALPVMVFDAGSDRAALMARGTISAITFGTIGVWLWYRPWRARGWRNVGLSIVAAITAMAAVYVAADLLLGGLIFTRGDLSKIGRGPLVRAVDYLLSEGGY